jgi:hypothetical protein
VGAGVVGVRGTGVATGVDEGLIHVKHEDMSSLCGPLACLVGDNEELILGQPLVDVVLELHEGGSTVVKNRNCIRKFSYSPPSAFSGNSLRPADSTAYFMNISAISSEKYNGRTHAYTSPAAFFRGSFFDQHLKMSRGEEGSRNGRDWL